MVVPQKETFKGGSWSWNEGLWHQFAQRDTYGHGTFGVNFHEVSISLYNAQYLQFLLQTRMLLRLIPEFGGDGTVPGSPLIPSPKSLCKNMSTTHRKVCMMARRSPTGNKLTQLFRHHG
jgi:hypothetical protein